MRYVLEIGYNTFALREGLGPHQLASALEALEGVTLARSVGYPEKWELDDAAALSIRALPSERFFVPSPPPPPPLPPIEPNQGVTPGGDVIEDPPF